MLLIGSTSAFGQGTSWKGLYMGGHAGDGLGTAGTTFTPLPDAGAFESLKPITSANALQPDPKGAMFGGQGGYNAQIGHLVIGGEAVFSISKMKGTIISKPVTQNDGANFDTTTTCADFIPPVCHVGAASALTAEENTKWLLHVRARAGVRAGRALIYGAVGPTVASVQYVANTFFGPFNPPVTSYVSYPADVTETRRGVHYGAGAEIAASPKVSVFGEFLKYDLKMKSATSGPLPAQDDPDFVFQVSNSWLTKAIVVRGGVNFRF
jgi:opacity protein-like surface antigen